MTFDGFQGGAPGCSRERPGYFFRLTEQSLILGAGMHSFSSLQSDAADRYRRAALDDVRGQQLVETAAAVGTRNIHGRTLKRVPTGVPADHPRADWLRDSGLYAETQQPVPPELYTSALADLCFEQYQHVAPLQQWLVELLSA